MSGKRDEIVVHPRYVVDETCHLRWARVMGILARVRRRIEDEERGGGVL